MNVCNFVAAVFAASLFALPAHADEGIAPVIGETRVTRDGASVVIRNGGEAPFIVEARLEFTDMLSKEVIASISFSRATVGAGKDSSVRLTASIPDHDALPLSAYLVRVVIEASAPENAGLVAMEAAPGRL